MIRILIILFLAWLLTSCNLLKPQIIYIDKDSIITKIETVIKDSIITVPAETLNWSADCLVDTVFIIDKKAVNTTVKIKKGKISVSSTCKEKDIIITKLKEELNNYKLQQSDSIVTKIERVKYIPGVYKFYSYGFYTLLALITAFALINKNIYAIIATSIASLLASFKKKK